MKRATISVILPVRDDPPVADAVASVLLDPDLPDGVEFFVVDNGSSPAFRSRLDSLPPPVRVLDEPVPGAGAARNRALDEARGESIFFLDADSVAAPGWVAAGLRGFAETGADILVGESHEMALNLSARLVDEVYDYSSLAPNAGARCDTKNLAVRRRVVESVRFDPQYLRDQDTVFGMAAERAGFRIEFWPEMRVQHQADGRLDVHLAKTVCGAWSWRKASYEFQGRARGRAPRHRIRVAGRSVVIPRPPRPWTARAGAWLAVNGGRALERIAPLVPFSIAAAALRGLHRIAAAAGAAALEANFDQPRIADVRRGRLSRSRV